MLGVIIVIISLFLLYKSNSKYYVMYDFLLDSVFNNIGMRRR